MYSLTALRNTRLDNVQDPDIPAHLKVITTGEVLTCSDAEYLALERNGLISGTDLAGAYGVEACWGAVYIGGSGGGGGAVDSVLAKDKSVLIAPTTGNVMVNVQLDPESNNALELTTKGLHVAPGATSSGVSSITANDNSLVFNPTTGNAKGSVRISGLSGNSIRVESDGLYSSGGGIDSVTAKNISANISDNTLHLKQNLFTKAGTPFDSYPIREGSSMYSATTGAFYTTLNASDFSTATETMIGSITTAVDGEESPINLIFLNDDDYQIVFYGRELGTGKLSVAGSFSWNSGTFYFKDVEIYSSDSLTLSIICDDDFGFQLMSRLNPANSAPWFNIAAPYQNVQPLPGLQVQDITRSPYGQNMITEYANGLYVRGDIGMFTKDITYGQLDFIKYGSSAEGIQILYANSRVTKGEDFDRTEWNTLPGILRKVNWGVGNVTLQIGDLWVTSDKKIVRQNVFYQGDVEPTGGFDELGGSSGGGVPEAPKDGKLYGRQDADWKEVPATSKTDYWRISSSNVYNLTFGDTGSQVVDIRLCPTSWYAPAIPPGTYEIFQFIGADKVYRASVYANVTAQETKIYVGDAQGGIIKLLLQCTPGYAYNKINPEIADIDNAAYVGLSLRELSNLFDANALPCRIEKGKDWEYATDENWYDCAAQFNLGICSKSPVDISLVPLLKFSTIKSYTVGSLYEMLFNSSACTPHLDFLEVSFTAPFPAAGSDISHITIKFPTSDHSGYQIKNGVATIISPNGTVSTDESVEMNYTLQMDGSAIGELGRQLVVNFKENNATIYLPSTTDITLYTSEKGAYWGKTGIK